MTHPWRDHPRLKGRFHATSPDDIQVIVHDGGPRLTDRSPEAVWVTVTGGGADVFLGRVLNQPQRLQTVRKGCIIKFVAAAGEYPLLVSEKYLFERPQWIIHPCSKCGLDELFDAPSDLIRVIFPTIPEGESMQVFTSFCGVCGGIQVVQNVNAKVENQVVTGHDIKKWWQFWK